MKSHRKKRYRVSASSFDEELKRGIAGYNGGLGRWWYTQAQNPCHLRAYATVADYIRASFRRPPALIVDYACGAGHLLLRLSKRFPSARLIGFDGSSFLLDLARRRMGRSGRNIRERVRLVETALPNFDLPALGADLVTFAFPNLVPSGRRNSGRLGEQHLEARDLEVADAIAGVSDPGGERSEEEPEAVRFEMCRDRLVSMNLRSLLRRGGICVRVEYASARRDELSRVELTRVAFEEGSLEARVGVGRPALWFRVVASSYFRSRVMEDVYQQTGDRRDRRGGYLLTVLRAL